MLRPFCFDRTYCHATLFSICAQADGDLRANSRQEIIAETQTLGTPLETFSRQVQTELFSFRVPSPSIFIRHISKESTILSRASTIRATASGFLRLIYLKARFNVRINKYDFRTLKIYVFFREAVENCDL